MTTRKTTTNAARELGHALDQTLGSIEALNGAVLAVHTLEAERLGEDLAPPDALRRAHLELRGALLSVERSLRALGAKAEREQVAR